MDTVLVFTLLLATWAVSRSLDRGSVRWFCLGMALVGVGFNIKMLQAYLVLPALLLAWFLTPARGDEANEDDRVTAFGFPPDAGPVTPGMAGPASETPSRPAGSRLRRALRAIRAGDGRSARNRFGGLAVGLLVLVVVSFSWATAVQLTPASARPYIGSSADNNVFNLIFGYNGLNRLIPRGWSIFGITHNSVGVLGGAGGGGGVGGVSENGPAGVFRLIDTSLGGQIGWLLPLALIGFVAAWGARRWRRLDRARLALVIWGGWLLTQAIFFSIAGFFHRYYLSMLSPAVAALAGIGIVALWRAYRAGGWRAWLLPAALVVTAAVQVRILGDYPTWRDRLVPAIGGLAAVAAVGLLVCRIGRLARLGNGWAGRALVGIGVAALLIAPATWSGITVANASSNAVLPVAGPGTSADRFGGPRFGNFTPTGGSRSATDRSDETASFAAAFGNPIGGPGREGGISSAMLAYLKANEGNAAYLVAVQSANEASGIILQTGGAVMAMGGFSGNDPILTVDSLKQLIASGQIRFFLPGGRGAFGGGGAFPGGSGGSTGRAGRESENAGSFTIPGLGGQESNQNGAVTQWIEQHCSAVPASAYGGTATGSSASAGSATAPAADRTLERNQTLYDCQGAATA